MAPPLISVVTPCLNARRTIEMTLRSVRDQQYPGIDHVVIDGGSIDGTVELIEATEGIRFVSEADRGLSHALNKGVAMARGDVIGWLNADDVYLPGALHLTAHVFAEQPGTLWATGRCLIIDERGREMRRLVTAYKDMLLRRYTYGLHLTQNFISAPSTFVSRRGFEEVGLFHEHLRFSMDYDLYLRLGRLSPPAVIDHALAAFRMTEGTMSMTWFERQFARLPARMDPRVASALPLTPSPAGSS